MVKKKKLILALTCAVILFSTLIISYGNGKSLAMIDSQPMLTAKHVFFFNLK
ncbi:hypothetical protein [Clostridium hydrogenum]|uniref:hypothetical protein n=1 Tax=Clostridium hydrogenum TaxID=2855764 RepID=UPI001F1E01D0|nr:hypothetical protein [Clostridium hydrogenum]